MGVSSLFDMLTAAVEYILHGLGWAAGVGGLCTVGLYHYQGNLLYYPSRGEELDPGQLGFKSWEDVNLEASDGISLHGWLIKHNDANVAKHSPTILMFHGNAGNLSNRLWNVHGMTKATPCNVMMLSYRGYGKSTETSPTQAGLEKDSQAALDHLRSRTDIDPSKIILFGRSLGAAVAVQLAANNPEKVRALVVENTFTSIPDMVEVVFPFLRWFKSLCTNPWFSVKRVPELRMPTLFISGLRDELVPASQMKKLYEACGSNNKKMIEFPTGQHNDTWLCDDYNEKLAEWLELATRGRPRDQAKS